MKFNKIRLVGANNVDLPLEGVGPITPYVLKAADGLGPPEVDVSIVPTLQRGGYYQGRRPQLRQVILRVGLQPEWNIGQTPQDLRTALYSLLTTKYDQLVKLQVMLTNSVLAQTEGHISKMEVAAFSKDPEVQITLDCKDAYLYAPSGSAMSITLNKAGGYSYFNIENIGTAPSGFRAGFTFPTAFTGPFILSENGTGGRSFRVDRDFGAGDMIILDTRSGQRGVWRVPTGTSNQNNILSKLHQSSEWLELFAGTNPFAINTENVSATGFPPEYTPAYWGI